MSENGGFALFILERQDYINEFQILAVNRFDPLMMNRLFFGP
jgi:hypothetical protein